MDSRQHKVDHSLPAPFDKKIPDPNHDEHYAAESNISDIAAFDAVSVAIEKEIIKLDSRMHNIDSTLDYRKSCENEREHLLECLS